MPTGACCAEADADRFQSTSGIMGAVGAGRRRRCMLAGVIQEARAHTNGAKGRSVAAKARWLWMNQSGNFPISPVSFPAGGDGNWSFLCAVGFVSRASANPPPPPFFLAQPRFLKRELANGDGELNTNPPPTPCHAAVPVARSKKRPSRPKPKGNGRPIRTEGSLAKGRAVEGSWGQPRARVPSRRRRGRPRRVGGVRFLCFQPRGRQNGKKSDNR